VSPQAALTVALVTVYGPILGLVVWLWSLSRQTARFQAFAAQTFVVLSGLLLHVIPREGIDETTLARLTVQLDQLVPRPRQPEPPTADERWPS
jgi:hypothetical protein